MGLPDVSEEIVSRFNTEKEFKYLLGLGRQWSLGPNVAYTYAQYRAQGIDRETAVSESLIDWDLF